jgi:prepilin-type N-terminal cleavage/methylation domain-containing protein
MDDGAAGREAARRRAQAGFSMAELLTVVVIMGLIAVSGGVMWQKSMARARATAAARQIKLFIHQARMKSIHQGVNHFVVIDPDDALVEVFEDTGTTIGSFDSADVRVSRSSLGANAQLVLPPAPSPMTSPLDATTVGSAWALPAPDTSARWGTDLRGVMTTPTGLIDSAAASPAPISSGVMVFTTAGVTTVVGIRGLEGSVRSYEWFDGAWREI